MQEQAEYWRHPRFRDLGLMQARFTKHRYDRHTHATYVIALITEGCERIRIGRQDVVAPAGTIAIVNPEEWHDGEAGAEQGWAYRTFYPSVALMTEVARELGLRDAPMFPRAVVDDPALAVLLAQAHGSANPDDIVGAECTMLLALRHLIQRHAASGERAVAETISGAHHRFSTYHDIVEQNLIGDLDLQRLARAGGVTRFQVIRDFQKVAGLTPTAFIRDRRMRRAGRLIAEGVSLADAAYEAGFADQSHLTRTFRAIHGVTPGVFRRAGCHKIQ